MDLSISALTSKTEAIKGELVEIQSYIARRPKASLSIDRSNNISTDIHHRTSVDDATNRGRLVPKMSSHMSDTHYHGEEISAETYATLRRHQFNLESLVERLQRMKNTTATAHRSTLITNNRSTTTMLHRSTTIQYQTPLDPDGYAKAIDGRTLHVSREDIADILQTANGADNMFMHQHSNLEHKATKEFYDTAGGIDNGFIQRSRHSTQTSINVAVPTSVDRQPEFCGRAFDSHGTRRFYWEEKDQRVLERASRDEPSYICLPEHASSFTQTKLVPKIYTKDEINEMFYGVCGEHEKNKEAFQMKLDGVYYPLNDSISWLTTCMEEMNQEIARIQHATDVPRPPSIDRR
ncbi:hypothetical protein DY000_02014341 [Brassica cretica]|uniref:Uncharacterized protein n=1 Tax=Brassica cretica TaxID=69181 RepID=A0ABQ7D765_BRACR|nr:hypothetical protein DY000_02014341 [Brassica cretica]